MNESGKPAAAVQLIAPQFADLSDRRAVVTGASRGIGRAIALEFARAGADVVIHSKSASAKALAVCEECRRSGNRAEPLPQDFSGECDWQAFVDRAWQLWGGIDLWVNNAGADLLTTPAADRSFADRLNILFEVDVRSTLLLAKEVGRRMREAGRGAIINIGWDQADRGMAGDSGELFAASKSAIMGFTRSLAVSLAPTVRVNCIAPGWIRTAWGEQASEAWQERVVQETPLARWGMPEDIAWLARFPCQRPGGVHYRTNHQCERRRHPVRGNGKLKVLFVTGRLAEQPLRRVVAALAGSAGFVAEVAVLGISVAALMYVEFVRRKLRVPAPHRPSRFCRDGARGTWPEPRATLPEALRTRA